MTAPTNWFENFFHGVALDLWRKAISPEQTQAEANFIEKELAAPVGSKFLDIPCGNGRLSVELAKRGYKMTGLDLSEEFLQEARSNPSITPQPQWISGDMRRLEWKNQFDGAFCFGNSFGYMEYPDMEIFLSGLSRALKRKGRFILETGIVAEALLPNYKEREWYQFDDILFTIENHYQADTSCLETKMTFVRNGKTETRESLHWVYTAAEIRRILERAGFEILETYESTDSKPFRLGSQELFVVSQKRA